MKRKLFTFLLAIVASIGLTHAEKVKIGGLYYNLNTTDKQATVTYQNSGYPYWSTEITTADIPSSVEYEGETYSVTSIGTRAFQGCRKLKSVTIPNSVATIGDYAFVSCSSLTSVTIPNSVTKISDAFYACDDLTSIIWNPTDCDFPTFGPFDDISKQITSFKFGDEVEHIPPYLCYGMNNLTSVTIPSSVKSIGNYAFCNCRSLTSMTIPNNVTSIGNKVFLSCVGLTSPLYNTTIFAYMPTSFSGAYTTPEGIECVAGGAFCNCNDLTSVTFGNSVTSIGEEAFYGCNKLTSVSIGESVTHIGDGAFGSCYSLAQIIWNSINGLLQKDDYYDEDNDIWVSYPASVPFSEIRTNITSFIIGDKVKTIPDYLCAGMENVPVFNIPCSVVSIGYNAFYNCNVNFRSCGKTIQNTDYFKICEEADLSSLPLWVQDTIKKNEPTTGWNQLHDKYVQYSHNNTYDSVINIVYMNIGHVDSIQIADTILCHRGATICDYLGNCQDFYEDGVFSYTCQNVYGCDSVVTRNVIVKQDTTYLDTTICYLSDLCIDGDCYEWPKTDLIAYQNNWFTWNRTLITKSGCDSVVSIKVYSSKIVTPTIKTTHEQDYSNSGKITLSGGKYDYYTVNGERNKSLSNLPSGEYTLAFYNNICDEPEVKIVQIYRYGMRVNSMYYLLNEENHTATLTYRGTSYSDYSGEYSGNLTIPESITFDGVEYQVTGINKSTFSGCSNIKSITLESEIPITMPWNSGLSNSCVIYVPYGSLSAYKSSSNWSDYNIHVIDPTHAVATCGATSASIVVGNEDEQKHIVSCGINGAEEFDGNVIEYCGLEQETTCSNVSFKVKTIEGDIDEVICSFTTTALELNTQPARLTSESSAVLIAYTNMADIETSCGFEFRRTGASDLVPSQMMNCAIANGTMAVKVNNIKAGVEYKYRPYYTSKQGNTKYGDWTAFDPIDAYIEYEPIVCTQTATGVTNSKATMRAMVVEGSSAISEQGFDVCAVGRQINNAQGAPRRAHKSVIGEHWTVPAEGTNMKVTLTDLDEGTTYTYRTYVIINGDTIFGSEQSFTTLGEYLYTVTFVDYDGTILGTDKVHYGDAATAPEDPIREGYEFTGWDNDFSNVTDDLTITATYSIATSLSVSNAISSQAQKLLRNGQLFILRDGKTYTVQGQEVR